MKTTVSAMISRDEGRTWSVAKVLADTSDAPDHPLLVTRGNLVFLSWQTQAEVYRFMSLEDVRL